MPEWNLLMIIPPGLDLLSIAIVGQQENSTVGIVPRLRLGRSLITHAWKRSQVLAEFAAFVVVLCYTASQDHKIIYFLLYPKLIGSWKHICAMRFSCCMYRIRGSAYCKHFSFRVFLSQFMLPGDTGHVKMQLLSWPVGSGIHVATWVFLWSPTNLRRIIKIAESKEE